MIRIESPDLAARYAAQMARPEAAPDAEPDGDGDERAAKPAPPSRPAPARPLDPAMGTMVNVLA